MDRRRRGTEQEGAYEGKKLLICLGLVANFRIRCVIRRL